MVVYPLIAAQTLNFDVVFTLSCVDASIDVPPASGTSLADDTYVVNSGLTSQSYSDILSLTTYTSEFDCGPINLIWYQSTVASPSPTSLNSGIT